MEMKKIEVKKCPYCKEEIIKTATVCKHCHTDFCSIDDKRKILHFIWFSIRYLLIIPAVIACIFLVLYAITLGARLCKSYF